ncbi:MAG TPA: PepSY-associated TM helix domain-containing protein, partial [Caulobacteraceae bacterium]
MAAVKAGSWRRLWLDVHLWIGAGLLIVLAPLGLSGSALVWDVQLDRLLNAGHYVARNDAARLGASAYLASGQAAFGDRATANQVRYPHSPGDPVVVNGRVAAGASGRPPRSLTAWLDPATGKLLDVGDPRASAVGAVHRLHGNLLLPVNGRPVVGWLGLAMAASCLTGLWLWWPRGVFFAGLGWRRGPNIFSNLHHMGGFWICVPLFALSVTGVYIAFPTIGHALAGSPSPPAASRGAAGQGASG